MMHYGEYCSTLFKEQYKTDVFDMLTKNPLNSTESEGFFKTGFSVSGLDTIIQ